MKFRTELNFSEPSFKINHQDEVALLGSCFTDNIGQKLVDRKFKTTLNPFGVLFNPFSISNLIHKAIKNEKLNNDLVAKHNNLWHSFEVHGSFSSNEKPKLIESANQAIKKTKEKLSTANYLFITFGTAWVYELKRNRRIVANCHKLPETEFTRSRLSVAEITTKWKSTIQQLHTINPSLKIIFTVSPIRHLKDGFHENQLSKATLHLAIDELTNQFPETCNYFPSYEIVMDDLRDYRFYQEDLVHISPEGVAYLFERFQECYFEQATIQLSNKLFKITSATKHLLQNSSEENNLRFAHNMLQKIQNLQQEFPQINFDKEIAYFAQFTA